MNFFSTVLAQATVPLIELTNEQTGNFGGANVANIISWVISAIVILAGLIFFFMLVIGGLKWILSGGDKGQTEQARSQITAALVGLVILFSAWAIARLIEGVFGISILQLTIPSLTNG